MASHPPNVVADIEHFLNRLSEEQLRLLNRMVVERIKLYHKARDLKSMARFNIMDRVYFLDNGAQVFGTIIKLNRRSATIMDDDGHHWTVSPSLLMRVRL